MRPWLPPRDLHEASHLGIAPLPWNHGSYQLLSLWDVRVFYVGQVVTNARIAQEWSVLLEKARNRDAPIEREEREEVRRFLVKTREEYSAMELDVAVAQLDRLCVLLQTEEQLTYRQFIDGFRAFQERVEDQLKNMRCMYIPRERAKYYEATLLFGEEVEKKFPALGTDISEAGNCFAVGRYTACAFHLMRVMEVGVQQLGGALGVAHPQEKNWQPLLDEVDKAIKGLPSKDPRKQLLSEVSAVLFAVKHAWRNPTMHPKATYTEEEAENLLRYVKDFMGHLATVI